MKTQKETSGRTAPQEEPELIAERLILFNDEGVARIGNGGTVGLERLLVCDANGKIGLDAKATEDGGPVLAFKDKGVLRAVIGMIDDTIGLFLCDGEGKKRTALTVTAEGIPTLSFFDASGASKVSLGLTSAGEGVLAMIDSATAPRVMLATIGNDPTLWLLNKQGKVVWEVAESTLPQTSKTPAKRRTSQRPRQRATTR